MSYAGGLVRFDEWVRQRWGDVRPCQREWLIAVMGLAGETGEVTEPCKKHYRDGKVPGKELLLELGDVLHYLTVIAASYGWSLADVANANVAKLEQRDAERAAKGEGRRP